MKIPFPKKRKGPNRTDLTPIEARSPGMANMMGTLLGPERTYRSDKKELLDEWLKWCAMLLDDPNATPGELQTCYDACPAKSLPKAVALRKRMDAAEPAPKPPRP
jgi:hypothetical protein